MAHNLKVRLVIGVSAAALAVAPMSSAFADHIQESNASERASCMAHEASAVSPPSQEGNGHTEGMPEELAFWDFLIENVPELGLKNRGSVAKALAQLHLPTHSDCDEFFGLPG